MEIDGSYLEGGGQIVRSAIALSCLTKKSVRIYNIRKGRPKPGLKPQHLSGVIAASKICNGEVRGAELNSLNLEFIPGEIKGGNYEFDIKTAGSITLLLQTLTPLGIFAHSPLMLRIRGGTAVPNSPSITYYERVFCHYLKNMGISIKIEVVRHGFYPKGKGEVLVCINPGQVNVSDLIEPGLLRKIEIVAIASEHLKNAKVGERLVQGFRKVYPAADYKYKYVSTNSPGCFIQAFAVYENCIISADALGERGIPAEEIGKRAANSLKEIISRNSVVDMWMVDQIIPYIALGVMAGGQAVRIKIPELTRHTETNIWVVKKFLPVEFEIKENILLCRRVR